MLFNSLEYLIFLPLVLLFYWQVERQNQNRLLLVASYVFYGWWDWRFLALILISTGVDYGIGLALGRAAQPGHRRRLVTASVVTNLGILGLFKYFDFFASSLEKLLTGLGFVVHAPTLEIILPVGISFYTFQTLSYTIGVYRRTTAPCRDLVNFAVFVAFFPQLVAGPIERAEHLIPQLEKPRPTPSAEDLQSGLTLILLGLIKKVVLADTAATLTNRVFSQPDVWSGPALLLGVYAFAAQIYGDFSGYTDVARGSSRLLGIELMRNFRQPYLSRSITEFWHRWHVSLSTWLRDYLYIPLGGNRRGRRRTYVNLMLVMLLGGLWHGAAWTFVVWGGLHGIFLAIHRAWRGRRRKKHQEEPLDFHKPRHLGSVLLTFHLVCLSWIFFRAESFAQAWQVLTRIVTWSPGDWPVHVLVLPPILVGLAGLDLAARRGLRPRHIQRWAAPVQGLLYGSALVALLIFWNTNPEPFIYFQF